MAYTYKEAIDIVKAQLVDIILLDLKLPDGLGTDIVECLHNNDLTKYLQSVIVVSGENELFLTIHDSPYVFSYIPKPYSLDVIYDDMVSSCVPLVSISYNFFIVIFLLINCPH